MLVRMRFLATCRCLDRKASLDFEGCEDIDLKTFQYVDHHKSKKKAMNFLKRMSTKSHMDVKLKSGQKLMEGTSLFLFSVESGLRRVVYRFINNTYFDGVILVFILLSTVQLAADSPLNDPDGPLARALQRIDNVTTAVFTLEMLMKILAFGLVFNGEHSYLQNKANILDFLVTLLSVSLESLTC